MPTAHARVSGQTRILLGACVISGAAFLQPATYNYIIEPMLISFGADQSSSDALREAPSIASLLAIFLAAVIADRTGPRRTLSAGSILLVVGSVLVASAPGLAVATAGLVVQSVGATVLLVVTLGVVGAAFEGNSSRATAFAMLAMVSPVVFVIVPLMTAALMQRSSWRIVALAWVVGGLAALIAGRWSLNADVGPYTKEELLTPALAGMVCAGLVQSISHGLSDGLLTPATLARIGFTVVVAAGLAMALRRVGAPSLDLAFLRRGGTALMLAVVGLWCFTQLWYYMTLAYEYVFGLSVLVTALLMAPAQVCAAVGARSAGWMVKRFGLTTPGFVLLIVTGISLALSVLVGVGSPLWWPVAITCLYSFASVAAGVPMTKALMDSATPGGDSGASAYRQAAVGVGTATGIALISALVLATFTASISALVLATFTASLSGQLTQAGIDSAQGDEIAVALRTGADVQQTATSYAVPLQEVEQVDTAQKQAYLDGMDAHGWAGAALSLATAGLFWFSRRVAVVATGT
ncbi:MAG: MFS transporter [Candidatus Nanopelagicales bacterium]|nr:MFS transporter [Candidatus Nanopelagicales bacterium]